ncbi:MAG TPA: O-antigen ligase family protein [Bryobacteraceae bacterium]|nr:O-antigen ligase family protein [Bryobacteraceae bacterium]
MSEGIRKLHRRAAWLLVCGFVFSIPWEKSVLLPGLGTLSRLLGALAFVAVAGEALSRGSLRRPNLPLALAAGFAGWTALTWLWSIAPGETLAKLLTFAQLFAMLWMIWEICRTPGRQAALMRAYIAGATIASVLTLLRYVRGLETYYRRYAAPGFDPNDLGLTVALSVPLALYLGLRDRGSLRWLYRIAILLATAAILLSASRTAFVLTACAYVLVPWTWRQADVAGKISGVVLFGTLLAGALYLAPSASRQRLATLPAEVSAGTLHNRTQIWKAGLNVARSHPFLGVGSGTYARAVEPQLGVPAIPGHSYVAHNSYLSVLVESGLIGLGLLALLLAALTAYVWIMPPVERAVWSVVLGMWMVGIAVLTWEHRKPGWLFFGLILTEWARSFHRPGERR